MTHYTNTNNPIDFPKKKEIPMLERFAAQSLVPYDGELIFSKERFAELIARECIKINTVETIASNLPEYNLGMLEGYRRARENISIHFGVEK